MGDVELMAKREADRQEVSALIRNLVELQEQMRQRGLKTLRERPMPCEVKRQDLGARNFVRWDASGEPLLPPSLPALAPSSSGQSLFHRGYDGAIRQATSETTYELVRWGKKSVQDTGPMPGGKTLVKAASHTYPHRCIGLVDTEGKQQASGSGFLVSPCHLLCAAHTIYNPALYGQAQKGFARSVVFYPGIGTEGTPHEVKGLAAWVPQAFIDSIGTEASHDHDYALVRLDWKDRDKGVSVGTELGWLGLAALPDDFLAAGNVSTFTSGYPAPDDHGCRQYLCQVAVDEVKTRTLMLDGRHAPQENGQSGSPAYYVKNDQRYAVGVVSGGTPSGILSACRITKSVLEQLRAWMAVRVE